MYRPCPAVVDRFVRVSERWAESWIGMVCSASCLSSGDDAERLLEQRDQDTEGLILDSDAHTGARQRAAATDLQRPNR